MSGGVTIKAHFVDYELELKRRPEGWRSAGAAGAELRPEAGRRKVPCCRRAISVWSGQGPDNQKPTGGGPAEGSASPGRCGVTLEGLG